MSAICRVLIVLALGSTLLSATARAHPQATPEASPVAACGHDRILFAPEQADGSTSGLVVADATTGVTLASFATPSIQQLLPLSAPGYALAVTDDDRTLLVDVESGTTTELAMPDDVTSPREIAPRPIGSSMGRVVVLYDGMHLLFLDTKTAAVTDFRSLSPDGEIEQVLLPQLDPNGDYAIVWEVLKNTRAWLVPLDDLHAARPLGPASGSISASFSPDGTQVIYSSLPNNDADQELYVEPVDGGTPRLVLSAKLARGIFLDNDGGIAADRVIPLGDSFLGQIVLIEPQGSSPTVLFPHEITGLNLVASPDGSHLLVSENTVDGGFTHTMIDIATGRVTPIPAADGQIAQGVPGSGFRLFSAPPGAASPVNPDYISIDLDTGLTAALLTGPTDPGGFAGLPNFSDDGSVATLSIFSAEQTLVWRLDLAAGTVTQISAGMTTGGMISPDGCAVLLVDTGSEPQTSTAQVLDAAGTTIASIPGTRMAIWLAD